MMANTTVVEDEASSWVMAANRMTKALITPPPR